MKKKKGKPSLGLIMVFSLALGCFLVNFLPTQIALSKMSTQLNVARNWEAVKHKIYCDALSKDKLFNEADRDIKELGVVIRPGTMPEWAIYQFDDSYANDQIGQIQVLYNKSGVIEEVREVHRMGSAEIEKVIVCKH